MRLSHLLLALFIPRIHKRAGDSLLDKKHSIYGILYYRGFQGSTGVLECTALWTGRDSCTDVETDARSEDVVS